MDDREDVDQREPHRADPSFLSYPVDVSQEQLDHIGVLHWKVDPVGYEQEGLLQSIRDERGYDYEDIICVSPDKLPNYENKVT
jgi:1,2-dihydroxy-3-keto-5-methylthiopentene dioxygenase